MSKERLQMAGVEIGGVVGIRPLRSNHQKRIVWLWRCHCGAEFERDAVAVKLAARRIGRTSCGCLHIAACRANGKANATHGLAKSRKRLYDVHRQMMSRCYNARSKDFPCYGARGIYVTVPWHSVATFMEWADESGYNEGLTIERVDVNGHYEPGNCTWIPNELQAHNTRRVRFLTFQGETLHISEWARRQAIHIQTVLRRLRAGWGVEDALTIVPIRGRNHTFIRASAE